MLLRHCVARTFVHQFAVTARSAKPAPTIGIRMRRGNSALRRRRRVPPAKPGLAAFKHAEQRGERVAELRRSFRGDSMSLGELAEHFRRVGMLSVLWAMFPQP
jgi:hypothetical protein